MVNLQIHPKCELSFAGKVGREPRRGDGGRGAFGAADGRILARPGAEHAFDLIAQVDAWCGGIQPDPADSGTADGLLARDLSAALPSLREEGRELRRHERPPLCDRAPDQAIASAPFLDHDMPRPFILAAPTWAFVPSMVPIVSFGKTTEPALFSMYLRRSRTLSRRLV